MTATSRPEPSAREWLERLAAADVSSRELTASVLDRIEAVAALNAVVACDREATLAAADAADAARRAGSAGPLLGLPVTVKDSIESVGLPTLSGSYARVGHVVERDATVVRRLREAGAIIIAKTNVPEYTWSYETENAVSGRTLHPADPARTPGGSSGGEAAVLGADASIVGIGTDGGGSIRVPCHYCGIVGLRPTAGLVPETGCWPSTRDTGMVDMNAVGPMARHVEDLALLLPLIAGPDGSDPFVQGVPLSTAKPESPQGLHIGFYDDDMVATPDDATRAAVTAAASALEAAGCNVEQVAPPDLSDATELFFSMMAADGGAQARADLAPAAGRHVPQMVELLESLHAYSLDASGYFALLRRWTALRRTIRAFVSGYDAVLAPVTTGPAPPHGCSPGSETPLESYAAFNYTHAYSIAGLPVAVAPAGEGAELPIGVQVVTNAFRDSVALAVAEQLERSLGGFARTRSLPSYAPMRER